MRSRILGSVVVIVAAAMGILHFRSTTEAQSIGCANLYMSASVHLTPGSLRTLGTVSPSGRIVISSVVSRAFASTQPPSLELYASGTLIGVVPGKCDDLGWHFDSQFSEAMDRTGFHLSAGRLIGALLKSDGPAGDAVDVTLVGFRLACNPIDTVSFGGEVSRDNFVTLRVSPPGSTTQVRAVTSEPFNLDAGATRAPSLEVREGTRTIGVIPAKCAGGGRWYFETDFAGPTGLVVQPNQDIRVAIRDATPIPATIRVSLITSIF